MSFVIGNFIYRLLRLLLMLSLILNSRVEAELQSPQAQGVSVGEQATKANSPEGERLLQLLRSQPALVEMLKSFLADQMRASGAPVSRDQITAQMLYERLQHDPQFARKAAQWLVSITSQVSQSLSNLPATPPASEETATAVVPSSEKRAGTLQQADKSSTAMASAVSTDAVANSANIGDSAVKASSSTTVGVPATEASHPLPAATASNQPPPLPSVEPPAQPSKAESQSTLQLSSLPKYLLQDQQAFWTLPFHLDAKSLVYVAPITFGTAILAANDTAIETVLPQSPSMISRAKDFSVAGALGFVGLGGGMYLWGHATHDEHKRETGFLMGEAMISAYATSTAFQYMTQRERPNTGNNKGTFFYGGDSFPSNTAALTWAGASVLAHEYPGWLTQVLAYGVASGVSAGRVIGQKHWTSDAVIGSALGWYMGRQIYRARTQSAEINASTWGTFEKSPEEKDRNPEFMGTTFVPLDSWVYPAMERLQALGFFPTMVQQIKPWARMECARLTLEAQAKAADETNLNPAVQSTIDDLRREFAIEIGNLDGEANVGAELESVYGRLMNISGRPLYDSWHFAQTIYDDFGRPYGQGANFVSGVSGRAEAGPLAFYVRGEYQHSAGMPNYSPELAQVVASYDPLPGNSVNNFSSVNRFRFTDAYVALNVADWELTAGIQSLWWGPDYGTSLMMSNNASPMPMLRVGRVTPYRFPHGPLTWIGEIKNTFFIGSVKGWTYLRGSYPDFPLIGNGVQLINPQPYTWGDKFVLKPTPNLEFAISVGVLWAGYTRPATIQTWTHTFSLGGNNQPVEPGKRYTGASFSYRIPGLRNWLMLYADGLANDEPSPISYARQSAWNPGIYMPKLPLLKNMDLRVEGVYTNVPNYPGMAPYYNNAHYALGYRNDGQLIGSWVGRQGSAVQAWSTYWFSPQKKIQVGYRRQWNDPVFEQGGGLTDFSASVNWLFKDTIQFAGLGQYERWNFPELKPWAGAMPQSNFTLGIQMTFWPLHAPGKSGRSSMTWR